MPSPQITLDDRAFRAALAEELTKMEHQAEEDLKRLGEVTADTARRLCPVDTGHLRDSVVVAARRGEQGFEVEIGTDVDYATSVEYGTTERSAKPFLRPALAQAPAKFVAG